MMNYKEWQAEQDLSKCGLSQESISAIRATSVINHNGAQHVVPNSQVGNFAASQPTGVPTQSTSTISSPSTDGQGQSSQYEAALQIQLQEQQRMFSRYKNFSEQRISSLESQTSQLIEQVKELSSKLTTLHSNQQARTASVQQSSPQQKTESKEPSKEPIDRNGISPESVQIDKIFYCGER